VALAFIAGCMFAFTAVSATAGFALFNRVSSGVSVVEVVEIVEAETVAVRETIVETIAISATAGLSPVTAVSAIPIENVNRLNISNRNGSLFINVHDSPYIKSSVPSSFANGTVSINNRNNTIRLYIPHCDLEAVIPQIFISNRNATIRIHGSEYENSLIANNLNIDSRNGSIIINNVALLDTLAVTSRNANIHLNNVLAPTEGVALSTRNGRIFTSE
jgi:hypothetical protein